MAWDHELMGMGPRWPQVLGTVIDSPAGRAGARMGDELLEVDGKSVVGLSAFQAATRIQVRADVRGAARASPQTIDRVTVCWVVLAHAGRVWHDGGDEAAARGRRGDVDCV